ncbi:MAG: high frequency lysogenization protein HflD [Thiotrichaceae bacterium]
MQKNTDNRTIALAALFQCTEGVRQLAHDGKIDHDLLDTCLHSISNENTDTIQDVYGDITQLKTGLKVLVFELGSGQMMPDGKQKNLEITRYAISLLHLEKKLSTHPELFQTLLEGIEDVQRQRKHFDATDETIINRLADIYSETISQLGPRIMVKGDQSHLGRKETASKIRALLLAGIRAALLWRQAGGSRWKLLLERGKMQRQAQDFLAEMKHHNPDNPTSDNPNNNSDD